jgi:hypothetical protein
MLFRHRAIFEQMPLQTPSGQRFTDGAARSGGGLVLDARTGAQAKTPWAESGSVGSYNQRTAKFSPKAATFSGTSV